MINVRAGIIYLTKYCGFKSSGSITGKFWVGV